MRSYAAGFDGEGKFALMKNVNGRYAVLCEADLPWQRGKTYEIAVRAHGAEISVCCEDVTLTYRDAEAPYLHGAVAFLWRMVLTSVSTASPSRDWLTENAADR